MTHYQPNYGPTEPLPGKGTTRCNRTACQIHLVDGHKWWNTVTHAFYCTYCAERINLNDPAKPMCIRTDSPQ